jgi:hypothetical protein
LTLARERNRTPVPVVGEKLRDVADRLRREVLDVEVDVRFQRCPCGRRADSPRDRQGGLPLTA